jgi:hypothetical protein
MGEMEQGEWCMFSNVIFYWEVGVIWVCIVVANSSGMCTVLGENGVFQFFFSILWYTNEYYSSMRCQYRRPRAVLFFWWSVVLGVLWWIDWSYSYLLFFTGMLLHTRVFVYGILSCFSLRCSFITSTDMVLCPLVLLGVGAQHHISRSKETTFLAKLSKSRLKLLFLILFWKITFLMGINISQSLII